MAEQWATVVYCVFELYFPDEVAHHFLKIQDPWNTPMHTIYETDLMQIYTNLTWTGYAIDLTRHGRDVLSTRFH